MWSFLVDEWQPGWDGFVGIRARFARPGPKAGAWRQHHCAYETKPVARLQPTQPGGRDNARNLPRTPILSALRRDHDRPARRSRRATQTGGTSKNSGAGSRPPEAAALRLLPQESGSLLVFGREA